MWRSIKGTLEMLPVEMFDILMGIWVTQVYIYKTHCFASLDLCILPKVDFI